MRAYPFLVLALLSACTKPDPGPPPAPAPATPARPVDARVRRDTVVVRDPELERRLARLELHLLEKEAQVEELQTRLADSRDEIVRTMARLRGNTTSRAEAASGMAEADVALQALRSAGGQPPELREATRLAQQSQVEFDKENFGGALYLANQAKQASSAARGRLAGGRTATRPGETLFAVPIRLRVGSRGNVREGPGTSFPVAFSAEAGSMVTGFSVADDWIRITDDGGRSGWIFRPLVARP